MANLIPDQLEDGVAKAEPGLLYPVFVPGTPEFLQLEMATRRERRKKQQPRVMACVREEWAEDMTFRKLLMYSYDLLAENYNRAPVGSLVRVFLPRYSHNGNLVRVLEHRGIAVGTDYELLVPKVDARGRYLTRKGRPRYLQRMTTAPLATRHRLNDWQLEVVYDKLAEFVIAARQPLEDLPADVQRRVLKQQRLAIQEREAENGPTQDEIEKLQQAALEQASELEALMLAEGFGEAPEAEADNTPTGGNVIPFDKGSFFR